MSLFEEAINKQAAIHLLKDKLETHPRPWIFIDIILGKLSLEDLIYLIDFIDRIEGTKSK